MKIGFIDYYLDEWHANNYPKWIREASDGEMEVAYAYGHIDSPIGGRTNDKWCADMGITRVDTMEELVAKSDRIIVLSPDNCEMHEQLCKVPLASGKPTYVDKTFAPDYETAQRIFAVADAHNTPCYSTSALRFAPEYQGISDVTAIAAWGPNGFETYSIHQLEPVMMLMKGKPEKVMYIPGEKWYTLVICFADGRTATISGYEGGSPFTMNVATSAGAKVIDVKSDFFHEFIVHMVAFFRDSSKIVPHEETLNIMAVRGAGVRAIAKPQTWIKL